MIELDAVWGRKRYVNISGSLIRVPFGITMDSRLVTFITRWILHSGTDFAAKRVKELKIWALRILAGDISYSAPWFKKIQYKGITIPRLSLFYYLLDNRNNLKVVKLILIVLNSYKLVTVGEPSLDSIVNIPKSMPADHYIQKLRAYCKLPVIPRSVLVHTPVINTRKKYCEDSGKTENGPYGLEGQLPPDIPEKHFFELYKSPIDGEFEGPISLKDLKADEFNMSTQIKRGEISCVGKVVPIPDKGRWRTILIGHRLLQCRTKKLADFLRKWLWDQPEVASGKQEKMSSFIIDNLKKGKMIYSIDLSNATDRLSRDFQAKLLISMGLPERYLEFLELPFWFSPKVFGRKRGSRLTQETYSNGQGMGLFLSFPMFELAHYVILKWVIAPFAADFSICGDDVVIACEPIDADKIFDRYQNLTERFGGEISKSKTFKSTTFAEGVGAIFLARHPKEIRIPSGKCSPLEAYTKGTWVYSEIHHTTPIGMALMNSWLQTKILKSYTYTDRTYMNKELLSRNLSHLTIEALRSLFRADHMPIEYPSWEESEYSFWRTTLEVDEERIVYHWVNRKRYLDNLVSNKIISLIKENKNDTNKEPVEDHLRI